VSLAVGLDLSITETGWAGRGASGEPASGVIKTKTKDGDRRLITIREGVIERAAGSGLALIEAPTPRSMTSVISGMVHGVVRVGLISIGVPYATVMPATLKKYATGNGAATKTDMAIAALKRGDREFRNDNECDAWWLWVMAQDYIGNPVLSLPKTHRDSLAKIRMEG
jgi:Holliday junction resolvasome RuvABC endonuclease subunit